MVRRIVSRAQVNSRPASASQFASTREIKLAGNQQRLQQSRAEREARMQYRFNAGVAPASPSSAAAAAAAAVAASRAAVVPDASRPPSPPPNPARLGAALRDLGPLYSRFQAAAQQAASDLVHNFPGVISTGFERTAYWKRAPPTQSEQLGTMAWLFLHYALPSPADVALVRSIDDLEGDHLRLSFRCLIFLASDWELLPTLTTKARLATLYHRFDGVDRVTHVDAGLTYAQFIKCMACVALEARIGATAAVGYGNRAKPAAASQNAHDRTVTFLAHLKWNNIEWVSSGLDALQKNAWYRLRMEQRSAKSVYVHKPTCIFRQKQMVDSGAKHGQVVEHTVWKTQPCPCASAPQWGPIAKQVADGVHDRPSVLHINPHGHTEHSIGLHKTKKPNAATLSNGSATRPTTAAAASGSRGGSAASAMSPMLTPDESRAYTALRVLDRLPLESTWCAFPGCYVDMGVIECLPALSSEPAAAAASASPPKRRDPSDLLASPLRAHKYSITLQNKVSAGLKVEVSSIGCEWLGLSYTARSFLPLGINQTLHIKAPTHMPFGSEVRPASAAGSAAGSGSTPVSSQIGQGVEKLGFVLLKVENSWTYATHKIAIPIYARLVLQGSSAQHLTTLPPFQPAASTASLPMIMVSAAQGNTEEEEEPQQRERGGMPDPSPTAATIGSSHRSSESEGASVHVEDEDWLDDDDDGATEENVMVDLPQGAF